MDDIDSNFKTSAKSLWDSIAADSRAGFRVPQYQREYSWGTEHLSRLLGDCLNGLQRLKEKDQLLQYTFLGSVILIEEESRESRFEGRSLQIVDGQQRITSLVLLSCVLLEELLQAENGLKDSQGISAQTKDWLFAELNYFRDRLYQCAIGEVRSMSIDTRFPKIVRENEDHRSKTSHDTEYRSAIACFLHEFGKYCRKERDTCPIEEIPTTPNSIYVQRNLSYLQERIRSIVVGGEAAEDEPQTMLESKFFNHKRVKALFCQLDDLATEQRNRDQFFAEIRKSGTFSGIVRLILFSSYFVQRVVLTEVCTKNEDFAFDAFDALNTTGEPLTSIETFRPRVRQYLGKGSRESGTEGQFKRLSQLLDTLDAQSKQKETKELVSQFALYWSGYKLGLDLRNQRNYLRSRFDSLDEGRSGQKLLKEIFVESLANVAEFRQEFWNRRAGSTESSVAESRMEPSTRLCLALLQDMRTRLVVPTLARFKYHLAQSDTPSAREQFEGCIRAMASFVAMRRAVTGGTAGIDSELRSIAGKFAALIHENGSPNHVELSIDSLKRELRARLAKPPVRVGSVDEWISNAVHVPVCNHSQPLTKFILLAAFDHTLPDPDVPGMLQRTGVRPSPETNLFTLESWDDPRFKTIEHVAPQSPPKENDWDREIYESDRLVDTLGNLVLLPDVENSSANNRNWQVKKRLYSLFLTRRQDSLESELRGAAEAGIEVSKNTREKLKQRQPLITLAFTSSLEDWDRRFIANRSRNLLKLAGERIGKYLDIPNSESSATFLSRMKDRRKVV